MRIRLLTKFTLTTSALVLGVMLLFSLINLGALRDIWLRDAVRDVDNLSETIIRTTYYQMLEGDQQRVFDMIDEVGRQQGIEHIRLINKDGLVAFSTAPGETGTLMDKDAAACAICHRFETPMSQLSSFSRSRMLPLFSDILPLFRARKPSSRPTEISRNTLFYTLPGLSDVTGILMIED